MGSTVQNVEKAGDGGEATHCWEAMLQKRQRLNSGRNIYCVAQYAFSLKGSLQATERKETRLLLGKLFGRMLVELLREKVL